MNRKNQIKVLIVDADQETLTIAKFCLGKRSMIVQTALSLEQGLQQGTSFQPDLILLSDQFTNFDPLETLKMFRAAPSLSKTPIVFLTVTSSIEQIERYRTAGALDTIYKPFDPLLLPSIVEGIWQKVEKSL